MKKTLITNMRAYAGGAMFMTRDQLAGFMGYSDAHSIDVYLQDVFREGKSRYFIPEIADNLIKLGKRS